jgi:hypothetical protein
VITEKQVPPPEVPVPKRRIVRSRSTAAVIPPGKKEDWEHQDLSRRHLLVETLGNDPAGRQCLAQAVRKPFDVRESIS